LRTHGCCGTLFADRLSAEQRAMSGSDAGYNFDRYRRLLAEADDEPLFEPQVPGKCIFTGQPTTQRAVFAKAY
jgi:hypothetical protein